MKTAIEADYFYRDRYKPRERVNLFVEKIFLAWISANAKGKKVLDSGCGNGIRTAQLTKDFDVTGIDISENNLKQARMLGLKAIRHDFTKKLPFRDAEFDTAVSCQVIEHVYDTDFYLSEIHRVLKKGGTLLITTPNAVSLTDRLRVMFGKLPVTCEVSLHYKIGSKEKPNGHIRPYTFPELRHQLQRIGFKVVEERTTNFPFPVYWAMPAALKKLATRLGALKPSFGGQIMVKAVKIVLSQQYGQERQLLLAADRDKRIRQ
ncbi:class I SAM-dependent methyltransferase [Candidatus Woesearchaeota archaeon]|nr:class I SAM-dependent methyltransferase [Candidatus Woesearchaeota archaeon]